MPWQFTLPEVKDKIMFTIRVYGILINESQQVLVSDEIIQDILFTKFCGGGLEFGEGTLDCVIREFKEEMNLDIQVLEHFYTTDFFQVSKFKNNEQVISIYYLVKAMEPIPENILQENIDINKIKNSKLKQLFRWIDRKNFGPQIFQLPIDKVVAEKLVRHLK